MTGAGPGPRGGDRPRPEKPPPADGYGARPPFPKLEFRDSLTEMDSRFRGNDGLTATASVKVTCLAEMTSFPRKRESIA